MTGAALKQLILISISGMDSPGLTSSITGILTQFDVNILDIGQAVIHDNLSLGILAEVPQQVDIEQALQSEAVRLRIAVRCQAIERTDYGKWVQQQGKHRHIITLLARKITARQISRLSELVAAHDLNIDNITRLSGRVPLDEESRQEQEQTRACVEFSVRGAVEDLPILRRACMELASELDVDIAWQEDNLFRRNRRLVAFDMDSTLIEMEVIDELAKRAGVGSQVAAITEQAMRGELDFKQSFSQRVGLLKGLPEETLEQVAAELRLTEGAERLVTTVRKLGYKTAILSGGFTYFGRVLQERLGIDYVYANDMVIENGVVTGEVSGEIVDGERKAQLLTDIAASESINLEQVIAVGDGANDLPMLSIAGLGIAFRAKPIVKASAKQSLSTLGLDGILYLMGLSERDTG